MGSDFRHWLQEAWESAFKTGCPLPKWGKICDKHFSENQLIRDEKKTRLKRDEVPTLNMPSIWISTPKFRKTLIAQKKLRLEEQQKSLLGTYYIILHILSFHRFLAIKDTTKYQIARNLFQLLDLRLRFFQLKIKIHRFRRTS